MTKFSQNCFEHDDSMVGCVSNQLSEPWLRTAEGAFVRKKDFGKIILFLILLYSYTVKDTLKMRRSLRIRNRVSESSVTDFDSADDPDKGVGKKQKEKAEVGKSTPKKGQRKLVSGLKEQNEIKSNDKLSSLEENEVGIDLNVTLEDQKISLSSFEKSDSEPVSVVVEGHSTKKNEYIENTKNHDTEKDILNSTSALLSNTKEIASEKNQGRNVSDLVKANQDMLKVSFWDYMSPAEKNQYAENELLKVSLKLKEHFPFLEHLRQYLGNEKAKKGDKFALDNVLINSNCDDNVKSVSIDTHSTLNDKNLYLEKGYGIQKEVIDTKVEKLMKKSVLPDNLENIEKVPKLFESSAIKKLERKKKREESAGKDWYNLPKTEMTEELKRDFQIIQMRNALDSKHHYKRNDSNKLPKYFQVGTIVEGAHEFHSARITKKQRKRTMVEELLADAEFRRKNKRRFIEIQKKNVKGGKGYYKKMKNKRKETWART